MIFNFIKTLPFLKRYNLKYIQKSTQAVLYIMGEYEQRQIDEFLKRKNFSHIGFGIGITAAITFLYTIPGSILSLAFPKEFLPYSIALNQIIFMLLPAVIMARFSPIPTPEMFRLQRISDNQIIFITLGLLVLVRLFAGGYMFLQDMVIPEAIRDIYEKLYELIEKTYMQLLAADTIPELFRSILVGALVPAVCEEFLFRGLLQRSLEEKLSPTKAIIISSVIFAVIHLNIIQVIPLFAIGLLLGYAAYKSGSLYLPMILHFLNNAIAILVMYFTDFEKYF